MIEYTVRPRDSLGSIAERFDRSLEDLLALNPQYRGREHRIAVGELIRLPNVGDPVVIADEQDDSTDVGRAALDAAAPEAASDTAQFLRVAKGQLTFDAEGREDPDSPWFSRKLHVPSESSGVTIGRGYDMKHRSAAQVERELSEAGVPAEDARRLGPGGIILVHGVHK